MALIYAANCYKCWLYSRGMSLQIYQHISHMQSNGPFRDICCLSLHLILTISDGAARYSNTNDQLCYLLLYYFCINIELLVDVFGTYTLLIVAY